VNGAGDVGERAFDSWAVHVPFCGCQMDDKLPLLKLVFTHAAVSSSLSSREERRKFIVKHCGDCSPHLHAFYISSAGSDWYRSLNNISRDRFPEVV
jgi:hypothetical protein